MYFLRLFKRPRFTRVFQILAVVGVLWSITVTAPSHPAQADNEGYDNYPWINTGLYNNMRPPASYSDADTHFIADHFDIASAHLQFINPNLQQYNPRTLIFPFTGFYLSPWLFSELDDFYAAAPDYTEAERESIYLHYKCDVVQNNVLIRGCNLANPETGLCSGLPATDCAASTATALSQSRVPDPDPVYQSEGWYQSNYLSQTFKDYGVWEVERMFSWYTPPADGIFWDNINYYGSSNIDKTIEYWGQLPPDSEHQHQRNLDYHDYFSYVKQQVEQAVGPKRWIGNLNAMWWVRSDGPYAPWFLSTLTDATPESWVSPIGQGEYSMPSWGLDCPQMKDAWDYTQNHHITFPIMTYNWPPDLPTRVFSIAKYYLVHNSYLYYGYKEDGDSPSLTMDWNTMAEINIGNPRVNPTGVKDFEGLTGTNKFFDWNNPTTQLSCSYYLWQNLVMARHYDNGLIIARWKGQRWQTGTPPAGDSAYNSYIDPIVYPLANSYHSEYYIVESDGTLSAEPVTSVTLRTNEAAMLLQVCSDGTVTSTCGCNGAVLNAGDTCVTSIQPSIERIDDVSMAEGEVHEVAVSASDPDCPDGACLTFSLPGFGPQPIAELADHGNGTATIRLAPDYDDAGTHNILVRVTDNGTPALSATTSFNVTVTNQLHPPVIVAIPDKQVHEQQLLEFDVIATDPKVGEHIILTAQNLPDGALFTDEGDRTGIFQWTPTAVQSGLYDTIQIIATDTDGSTVSEPVTINVLDGLADCTPNWDCTDWSVCVNSLQTRTCHDNNDCGSDADRPVETAGCDSTAPGAVLDLVAS